MRWTREDIEAILLQLNERKLPFEAYEFTALGQGMELIGKGAFSQVYAAKKRSDSRRRYALKVLGFGDKHVDCDTFQKSTEAQQMLGYAETTVVHIYDYTQLRVWIEGAHTVTRVEKAEENQQVPEDSACLQLQFVLMEEVIPILSYLGNGQKKLYPHALMQGEEKEILKLAYDIGLALQSAHGKKLIHRDVKPENLFYSTRDRCYKLGDFGIARKLEGDSAKTVAFTKGYGAPEVIGSFENKYDETADIYSFGMTLYVLLNEMRFPAAAGYSPCALQYTSGFVADRPQNGSDALCEVVLRMLSYHPDARYQTMEEVLNAIEQVIVGNELRYQREHRMVTIAMGAAFCFFGAVCYKLAFAMDVRMEPDVWIALLLLIGIGKGAMKLREKSVLLPNLAIAVLGMVLLFTTGFSWMKLCLYLLCLIIDMFMLLMGVGAFAIWLTQQFVNVSMPLPMMQTQLRWVCVLLFSLMLLAHLQYYMRSQRDGIGLTKLYAKMKVQWIEMVVMYLLMLQWGWMLQVNLNFMGLGSMQQLLGAELYALLRSCNLSCAGLVGMVLSLLWIGREYIQTRYETRSVRKK